MRLWKYFGLVTFFSLMVLMSSSVFAVSNPKESAKESTKDNTKEVKKGTTAAKEKAGLAENLAEVAKTPRILLLGDSISYDGRWANLIGQALLKEKPFAKGEFVNMGVPSETVSGLSEPGHAGGAFPRPSLFGRLDRVLADYKPQVVLVCYGMNDGIYLPLDEKRFGAFKDGMERVKKAIDAAGAKAVFITPPLFMADRPEADTQGYDKVLDAYGTWLVGMRKKGWLVADMRPELRKLIAAEKKKTPGFVYAGDNVHPGDIGHALIAQALWKELSRIFNIPSSHKIDSSPEARAHHAESQKITHEWLTKTGHDRPGIPGYREPSSGASEKSSAESTSVE